MRLKRHQREGGDNKGVTHVYEALVTPRVTGHVSYYVIWEDSRKNILFHTKFLRAPYEISRF